MRLIDDMKHVFKETKEVVVDFFFFFLIQEFLDICNLFLFPGYVHLHIAVLKKWRAQVLVLLAKNLIDVPWKSA